MKNFKDIREQCIRDLQALNCPISTNLTWVINTRAKSRWGRCAIKPNQSFEIQISDRLLTDDVPDSSLKQTIYHELLHTIPNGMTHKGAWRIWADRINEALGTNITRTTSAESLAVSDSSTGRKSLEVKYVVQCQRCGGTYHYRKLSAIVRELKAANGKHSSCRCRTCGSDRFNVIDI